MKNGRTNIKTGVEIGVNNIAKKERQTEVEDQLNELIESEAALKESQRKMTFVKKDLSPKY